MPLPPKFPRGKTETALIDEIGSLAARNDILRVMHAEMREQRDTHERFIHEQYEKLWYRIDRIEGMVRGIVIKLGGPDGDAEGNGEMGAEGEEEHGAKRHRRKPAPRARGKRK
jgi:hypothetical protein